MTFSISLVAVSLSAWIYTQSDSRVGSTDAAVVLLVAVLLQVTCRIFSPRQRSSESSVMSWSQSARFPMTSAFHPCQKSGFIPAKPLVCIPLFLLLTPLA